LLLEYEYPTKTITIKLGTIAKGAELLHQEGAREVYACCTHAVFRYDVFTPIFHIFFK
jgi:phosphoribosylpyrophosphate synthetase